MAAALENAVGLPVSVGNVRYFPFTTIEVSEVGIADADSMPMLVLARAKADISIASVVSRSIEIARVEADSIGIFLRQDNDGHYNIEKIGTTDTSDENAIIRARIGRIRTSNCRVSVERKGATPFDITNLGLDVSDFHSVEERLTLQLNRLAFALPSYDMRAILSAKMSMSGDSIRLTSCDVGLSDARMKIDSIAAVMNGKEVLSAHANIRSVVVPAMVSSKLIGKEMGKMAFCGLLDVDSTEVSIQKFRLSYADKTYADISGHISRKPREGNSIVNINELHTNITDINTLLSEPLNVDAEAVGLIRGQGKVRMNGEKMSVDINIASAIGNAQVVANGQTTDKWNSTQADVKIIGSGALGKLTNGKIGKADVDISAKGEIVNIGEKDIEVQSGNFIVVGKEIDIIGHTYDEMKLRGVVENKIVYMIASVTDADGEMITVGEMDLNKADANISLTTQVSNALMDKLNIVPHREGADLSFRLSTVFSSKLFKNTVSPAGSLRLTDLRYTDIRDTIYIPDLNFVADKDTTGQNVFTLKSDIGHGQIRGKFTSVGLANEIVYQLQSAAPSIFGEPIAIDAYRLKEDEEVEIALRLDGIRNIVKMLKPEVDIKSKVDIRGHLTSAGHESWLNIAADSIAYDNIAINDAQVAATSLDGQINVGFSSSKLNMPMLGDISKLRVSTNVEDDDVTADIGWQTIGSAEVGGIINMMSHFSRNTEKDLTADIAIDQSQIVFQDSTWHIDSCRAFVSADYAHIDNLNIRSGERYATINGDMSQWSGDTLHIALNKIVLEDLIKTNEKSHFSLAGDLYASAHVSEVYGQPRLFCDAHIERLNVNGDDLDRLELGTRWIPQEERVDVGVAIITKGLPRAWSSGYVDLSENNLNLDFNIDSLSTGFLNFYLSSAIRNWKGTTSGKLKLYGPLNDIQLSARLKLNDDNTFVVKQTGVGYRIDKQDSVFLSPNNMIFDDIRFADAEGNRGVFSGNIYHNMFSNNRMNMHLDVNKVLVLKTTEKESPTYYGTVYASGNMSILGTTQDVRMAINAQTEPGSTFCLTPTAKGDISGNDYILFQNTTQEQNVDIENITSSVTARLDLDITPDAQLRVVINPATDNQLTAYGKGRMIIGINKSGDININGDYNIERGLYNFTFENIINKQFEINNGSRIVWEGDPYDATLDVSATYKVKASLYELVQGMEDVNSADLKRRVPINCNILLSNKLTDPDIKFDIKIPSSQNFSQYTFDQYVNTEDEMNRQVFSLLLAGRFYATQEASDNNATQGSSYLGTTASEMLSNQLSSLISQNKYNLGVGVNYRPGDKMMNEEYEVAVSSQLLDNKIILSGNIGYGRDASNTTEENSGSLIGDFDIDVKLNRRGNIRAKAYTHSNNDVIYETSPTTQGVGISFQEEFSSFRQLIRNYARSIFHRRKKENAESN